MIKKIMKQGFQDHSPKISLTVLGTLCFVTLIMCQTRFKITKEINREVYPPMLKSKDCWLLYTFGNSDRFKCVLRAFIVITSPVLSFISTALLLFGKVESNPYFFIPWLFLTIKGLLLIQTNNLITILKDMGNRANYVFGFQMEDLKWLLFYGTIFMIDLVEAFSFCEIFDLFLVLWNHHPGYNIDSAALEAVKKDIADIMEALSKCSLGSLSKISMGSTTDSDENLDSNMKKLRSRLKCSSQENEPPIILADSTAKNLDEEEVLKDIQKSFVKSGCDDVPENEKEITSTNPSSNFDELMNNNCFPKAESTEPAEKLIEESNTPSTPFKEEFENDLI